MEQSELGSAVARLAAFLAHGPLTATIAELEHQLVGLDAAGVTAASNAKGVDGDLLRSALIARSELGRVSDLIHAAAIVVLLPRLLGEDEVVTNRPSLAAGNDPTRPFDLETNLRVAEFKLSQWAGADAMRKRQVFKDLVHLAADRSGRRPELFVVGQAPIDFLRRSRSNAAWALDRFPATRQFFVEHFGPLEVRIADFTAGPAAHVKIMDLNASIPEIGTGTSKTD
ncbi:hypothetical protein [Miltoncostaea marina]|uniref:hypothetical protein n=1 Tax=Miltoncostaea marina TaxID=2843215 RepID=UPI001C3E16F6|nr:hypothetical protein [Miltoncostaea marina]